MLPSFSFNSKIYLLLEPRGLPRGLFTAGAAGFLASAAVLRAVALRTAVFLAAGFLAALLALAVAGLPRLAAFLVVMASSMTAWAAASREMGTRNGEEET